MFKAGLIGVTGYTGMELARLLAAHGNISLVAATSRQEQGKQLADLYPFLRKLPGGDVILTAPDPQELAKTCDIVFLAVPHGVSMETGAAVLDAAKILGKKIKVVDLSADFRIRNTDVFSQWYKIPHTQPEYLKQAVYGLIELYAEQVKQAALVANPGCYPTASILGLYAALKNDLIKPEGIVIDAKSGTTGAGRKAAVSSLYCEVADSFRPYNLGKHRHTPEIEQELSLIAGQDITLSFNPHLLPIQRGILATIYTELKENISQEEVQNIFAETWKDARFVRVLPSGSLPECRYVRGSMFCDIAVTVDSRTKRLVITSAIDNLCRGASGQALANANLMLGLPLWQGLEAAPLVP